MHCYVEKSLYACIKDVRLLIMTNRQVSGVFEKNVAIVNTVGSSAVNAINVGGQAAVDFITSIDVEKAINDTEDAVLTSKTALIKGAFDAKREAIRFLAQAKEDHKVD